MNDVMRLVSRDTDIYYCTSSRDLCIRLLNCNVGADYIIYQHCFCNIVDYQIQLLLAYFLALPSQLISPRDRTDRHLFPWSAHIGLVGTVLLTGSLCRFIVCPIVISFTINKSVPLGHVTTGVSMLSALCCVAPGVQDVNTDIRHRRPDMTSQPIQHLHINPCSIAVASDFCLCNSRINLLNSVQ